MVAGSAIRLFNFSKSDCLCYGEKIRKHLGRNASFQDQVIDIAKIKQLQHCISAVAASF